MTQLQRGTDNAINKFNSNESRSRPLAAGAGAETASLPQENRKILIVSREARFSESVVNYAVNLAERLGYDLIALNVGPGSGPKGLLQSPYRYFQGEKFKKQRQEGGGPD